jgi:hypothetical protein
MSDCPGCAIPAFAVRHEFDNHLRVVRANQNPYVTALATVTYVKMHRTKKTRETGVCEKNTPLHLPQRNFVSCPSPQNTPPMPPPRNASRINPREKCTGCRTFVRSSVSLQWGQVIIICLTSRSYIMNQPQAVNKLRDIIILNYPALYASANRTMPSTP